MSQHMDSSSDTLLSDGEHVTCRLLQEERSPCPFGMLLATGDNECEGGRSHTDGRLQESAGLPTPLRL